MSALRCKRGGWQGPWGGLGIPGTHCPPPTAWLELDPKALHWMHPRLRAEEGWWGVVCTQPREGGTAGQAETTHCAASELSRAVHLSRIKDPRPEALVNRICRLMLSKDGPIPVPRAWENTTLGHKRARLQTELGLPTVRDENRKGSLDHPSGA